MIRNRLSELFSERGLKTSRVAKDVSIARSSLTSMVQNDSEMIRIDAIDKLCNYLNISPNEFFEYIPVDIDLSFEDPSFIFTIDKEKELKELNESLSIFDISFEFLVDINNNGERETFDLVCSLKNITHEIFGYYSFNFYIKNEDKEERLKTLIDKLSPGMKHMIYRRLRKYLKEFMSKELMEFIIENEDKEDGLAKNEVLEIKEEVNKAQFILLSNVFTEY